MGKSEKRNTYIEYDLSKIREHNNIKVNKELNIRYFYIKIGKYN